MVVGVIDVGRICVGYDCFLDFFSVLRACCTRHVTFWANSTHSHLQLVYILLIYVKKKIFSSITNLYMIKSERLRKRAYTFFSFVFCSATAVFLPYPFSVLQSLFSHLLPLFSPNLQPLFSPLFSHLQHLFSHLQHLFSPLF